MSEIKGYGSEEPARGDQRKRESAIVLSSAQREAINTIVSTVEQAERKEKFLFLLEGVSGIGKSMVGDEVGKILGDKRRPRVVALESPDTYRIIKEMKASLPHSILAIGTPREIKSAETYKFEDKEFSDYKRTPVLLKGMNHGEITEYIQSLGGGAIPPAALEEIATYSLGVPLLAQRMMPEDMSTKTRQMIAAGFLRSNVDLTVKQGREVVPAPIDNYFNVEIPRSVRELAKGIRWKEDVYASLADVLTNLEALHARGQEEESPFFVAPQSEGIYDSIQQRRVEFNNFLNIYVPQINQTDFERIKQAIGSSGSAYDMSANTARTNVFFGNHRKTAIHLHTKDSDYWGYEGKASERYKKISSDMESDFQKGKYPIKRQVGSPKTSFHLSAWGHESTVYNQIKLGWALETLLQHRGIAYIVENQPADMWYVYNPLNKSIEPFTPPSNEK